MPQPRHHTKKPGLYLLKSDLGIPTSVDVDVDSRDSELSPVELHHHVRLFRSEARIFGLTPTENRVNA